jgi:hypothetical protein
MVVRRTVTSQVTALTVFATEMSIVVFVAISTRDAMPSVRGVEGLQLTTC